MSEYIKKENKFKIKVVLVQALIIIGIIITWELLAKYQLINTFIFSSPSLVMRTIINLGKESNLFIHIWTTVYETLIAFTLGLGIGFIFAIILYSSKFLSKVFDPFLTLLNSLPKVALGPILIIWAGANTKSIILMALFINLIISTMTIYNGFITTPVNRIKLLKSFKATKYEILKDVVIPSNFNTIISSLKLNISMSLIGVIMGEFLVSKAGIGYLIMYGSQVFNLNLVISGIIILLFISFTLYQLIIWIEKKLIKNP